MGRTSVDDMVGSLRVGVAGMDEKAREAVAVIADKVEDAVESANVLSGRVKKELSARWKVVDRTGRDNAFLMAAGALGIGVLIGYLIARDRD